MAVKYIELFAGVGGFRVGIERALGTREGGEQGRLETISAFSNSEGHGQNEQRTTCVFANEWDKYAARTYNKNFGAEIDQRDITTISTGDIPEHDLLVGGFPCQAFSVAGKRHGFEESRGTLFFEIARILKDKRPQHLVLENVKGLLSHDSGRTFQVIIGVLADLGYRVEWQVLNSKDFGVPQNRERVFLVGHLGACCGRQVFPLGADNRAPKEVRVEGGSREQRNSESEDGRPTERRNLRIRRLTPVECERLQGFPDNWTAGVSDTQRYKQMGNAVTTNVIEAVIRRLYGS